MTLECSMSWTLCPDLCCQIEPFLLPNCLGQAVFFFSSSKNAFQITLKWVKKGRGQSHESGQAHANTSVNSLTSHSRTKVLLSKTKAWGRILWMTNVLDILSPYNSISLPSHIQTLTNTSPAVDHLLQIAYTFILTVFFKHVGKFL